MLRASLIALLTTFAAPAMALCSGESFIDQLSPEDRAAIEAADTGLPYAVGTTWELTKGDKTLTVVGTMHVYDTRLEALRTRVLPAIQGADLLMVEATSEQEQAMQEAFAAQPDLYLITDGPTLPDLLAPETWEKVKEAAADRGIPGFMVAQMQPWYLSLTLGIPACALADMVAGQRGLDHMLIADAEAAGVPLQALESWELLIETLSDGTMEEQIAALDLSLVAKDDQQALFVAMLDAYFAEQNAAVWTIGEVAARTLTGLSAEEAEVQMLEVQDLLLNQRNLNWIPVITAASDTHNEIVIAAGAAHLPGELGILRLLENEGWAVERLR